MEKMKDSYLFPLYLNPLKNPVNSDIIPNRGGVYTFDVETKDGIKGKELFCWSLAFYKKIKVKGQYRRELTHINGFDDLTPIFDKLLKWKHKNKNQIIYVQNLGFDIRFILDYCARKYIVFYPYLSGSSMLCCIISEYNVCFIDTFQFLRTSQEKSEIEWNIDEKFRKIDCSKIFNKLFDTWTKKDKQRVIDHNKNDTYALLEIMLKMRKTYFKIANVDICSVISLASLALKAFRLTLKKRILNPFISTRVNSKGKNHYKYNEKIEQFIRKSYYGGRTEIYDLTRRKNVLYIDKVSMFSSSMKYYKYPVGKPEYINDKNVLLNVIKECTLENCEIISNKKVKLGFIKAEIVISDKLSSEATQFPVLPKRLEKKVMFTNCDMIGIWTTIELNYAYNHGYTIIPIEGYIFSETDDIFSNFVDKFFKIKSETKGGKKQMAKFTLNMGYGKFGESIKRRDSVISFYNTYDDLLDVYPVDTDWTNIFHRYSEDLKLWIIIKPEESIRMKSYMIVSISSFVTSYSRIQLLEGLYHCSKSEINVLGSDTDSIAICESDLLKFEVKFPLSHDLGAWDIEMNYKEIQFVAPKAYFATKQDLSYLIKLKGCNKTKLREIERIANGMDEIERMIREPIVMAERYTTYRESLRNGTFLATKIPTKHYSFENLKRNFTMKISKPWTNLTLPEKFKKDLFY